MVTDPETLTPLRHQWQAKGTGEAWANLPLENNVTFMTSDDVRGKQIRLVQKTDSGATGRSNELTVTNVLENDLSLGQDTSPPLALEGTGTSGSFFAIGGGISADGNWVFYQGKGDGYFVEDDGKLSDYIFPIGGDDWETTWFSPWGGAAHTRDGKYIVHFPGNVGNGLIRRSPAATFDGNDRPSQVISSGLPDYGKYGTDFFGEYKGYFSGATGTDVAGKEDRFYAMPYDHDKVMWIDAGPNVPQGTQQFGFININMNGSTGDLTEFQKWGLGTLAGNGKIYCPPRRFSTREMLIIDTNNDTAEIGPFLDEPFNPGSYAIYSYSCMGKDGCIYILPNKAYKCWKLDPSDDSLLEFGNGDRPGNDGSQSPSNIAGFGQPTLYPDGHIYSKQIEGGKHYLVQLDTDSLTWKRWEMLSTNERSSEPLFLDLDANIVWTPQPDFHRKPDVWNRGYGAGPWPMPGVPGGMLDPRLPYFSNHSRGA